MISALDNVSFIDQNAQVKAEQLKIILGKNIAAVQEGIKNSPLNNAAYADPNADGLPDFDIIMWFRDNWRLAILGAVALLILIKR